MDSPPAQSLTPEVQSQHSRRWRVLGVVGVAQLMIVLDATIVNIALPNAQHDLGFANSDRQWIVTAYALAFGSLLLLGGRLGDLFGRKWTFIGGLIGFAVASAAGGAAPDFAVLAGARALQGVFGALLAPSALSLLATTFTDPKERGKAFAVFGAVAGGGGAVGLLLGGALTSYLSWRWCLYVNLFFAAFAVVGGLLLLSNPPRPERPRIDVPSAILASAGLFAIVFGFSRAQTDSWGSPTTLVSLVLGAVLLAAFVQVQRTVRNPLLPLRVILDRNRAGAYLAVGLTFVSAFGLFLFLTFYLQNVRDFSPVKTGLAFLPLPVDLVIASTIANVVLLPRFGSRRLIVSGLLMGFVGFLLLTRLNVQSSYTGHVFPALVIIGLGFGAVVPPALNSATRGVDFKDAGVASAMVNTMQQVGGSIGAAMLSAFAAKATSRYLANHTHGTATATIANLAATHGYTIGFTISAGILLGAAVLCGAMIRKHPTKASNSVVATPSPAIVSLQSEWAHPSRTDPPAAPGHRRDRYRRGIHPDTGADHPVGERPRAEQFEPND
jgi:EmrB/QacA subfamily drug resistance transporter